MPIPYLPAIIVGAGHAGFQTAASLRERGFQGDVVLLSDEAGLPYQRPPLSKSFLQSDGLDAKLRFREAGFFVSQRIERRFPDSVSRIDRVDHRVELASGGSLQYGHLVLATGARPRRPAWAGMELEGVLLLRSMEDAKQVRLLLQASRKVVIIGAGFIGLELASAASTGGRHVTVIEFAERALMRAVSSEMATYIQGVHERRGVEFVLGTSVTSVRGVDGRVAEVVTADGSAIEADLVLVGIGVVPNTGLAEAAGLTVEDGIVVDEFLLTKDPMISAIGDCARYPSSHFRSRVRLESVQNATDQARTVAMRLTGEPAVYDKLPWFWSDQGDLRMQMCGLPQRTDDAVLRGNPDSGRFSVFRFRKDELTGIESVNDMAEHMAARRVLSNKLAINRKQAADRTFKLKDLTV